MAFLKRFFFWFCLLAGVGGGCGVIVGCFILGERGGASGVVGEGYVCSKASASWSFLRFR